ncbi:hypothetical protein Bbelb_397940 [Branchiostoma belcheri]|nr:hypothetical protein Bbelb_397940 [Branchiostoma belcheri]
MAELRSEISGTDVDRVGVGWWNFVESTPIMATWSRTLFHYSMDFLRGLKRVAAPSDPHLKEHLLSLGVWRLRTRARGKRGGRHFQRDIPTVVGNRPLLFNCKSPMSEPGHVPLHTCKLETFLHVLDNLDVCTRGPTNRVLTRIPLIRSPKRMVSLPALLLANVRSLRHKTDELHAVSLANKVNIVAVTETWLNSDIPDSLVSFPDYAVHRRDRISRSGGGVALYISPELRHKRLSDLESDEHEALWLWVRPARLPRGLNCLIIAALYNPPKSSTTYKSDDEVNDYLGRCLVQIKRDYLHPGIIILGDTNKYNSQSLCARYGLKQVVNRATRGHSQLDSILTNVQGLYSPPVHLPPIGTSDHQTVLLSAGPWPATPPQYIIRRRCTPDGMRRLGLLMNTTDFTPVFDAPNPQRKVAVLSSLLEEMLDRTVPKKKSRVTKNDKPWMSNNIKQHIVERQDAFRSGNIALYAKLRSTVAKLIKNAKRWYYQNEVDQLKHSSSGQWFRSVKNLIGMGDTKRNTESSDLHSLQRQCNSLSDHFASVWNQVERIVPTDQDVSDKLSHNTLPSFSIGLIKSRLRTVNGRKAAGPDNIPPWVLKLFHEELAPVLCEVFNSCVQHCTFPLQWKQALVSAVPKKPRPNFPTDYRQISVVSCVGKVYEDFGVRRDLWLSIRSYLEGRSQRVKWGSCLSKPHDVLAGVPQGGLLSPLLFVICINSLDTCLPSSVLPVKYADDLTNSEFLMGSLPGQTQRALDAITEWSVPFSLATNGGKTKDMIVSARRKENVPVPAHPTVDGKQIERVVTFKLLGVQISADLTWDAHVQYMLSKTRPRIYYLAAARKAGLPSDVLTQIYLSFIRPILEYASPVWGGLPIRLTHILEGVQKRCCRIMGIPTNSLPTLASRRDQATLRVFRSILDDKDNSLNCFISRPLHSG